MRSSPMLFAALLAAMSLATVVRANCGAEGCPLLREGLGAEPSRFAFDLRYQDVTQDKLWNGTTAASLSDLIAGADLHSAVELFTHTRSWVAEGAPSSPTECASQ